MSSAIGTFPRIRPRERTAVLQSLRAGVVPRIGLQHIQVGRKAELDAILHDLDVVQDGGAAIRFVIGRFGSGKSFFLNLASILALEKGFLVARADITTERRLHGSSGQARGLYGELIKNLSSKARPEGGALAGVIERWIGQVMDGVSTDGSSPPDIHSLMRQRLRSVQDMVSGYDFATVLTRYFEGNQSGNNGLQENAIRWLRAEYHTKTDARNDLGVRAIIEDTSIYDYLKLLARFARLAGYAGLVVCVDEMVVLSHRLANSKARASNYESILRMLNDCLQGGVEGLMLLFAGTDEFLEDRRRGLYSYEALATRLAPNSFATENMQDLAGPVIRLRNLTPEDLFVLLFRIRDVFALGDAAKYLIPDEGLKAYVDYSARTLGEQYFKTPRDTVTRFVGFLNLLEANSGADWREVLGHVEEVKIEPSQSAESSSQQVSDDDDLVEFRL